jgi:hypothetical protein
MLKMVGPKELKEGEIQADKSAQEALVELTPDQ